MHSSYTTVHFADLYIQCALVYNYSQFKLIVLIVIMIEELMLRRIRQGCLLADHLILANQKCLDHHLYKVILL